MKTTTKLATKVAAAYEALCEVVATTGMKTSRNSATCATVSISSATIRLGNAAAGRSSGTASPVTISVMTAPRSTASPQITGAGRYAGGDGHRCLHGRAPGGVDQAGRAGPASPPFVRGRNRRAGGGLSGSGDAPVRAAKRRARPGSHGAAVRTDRARQGGNHGRAHACVAVGRRVRHGLVSGHGVPRPLVVARHDSRIARLRACRRAVDRGLTRRAVEPALAFTGR